MGQEKIIPLDLTGDLEKFINGFEKLRNMGFVKSHRSHNTGIGKTLEDLMGVKENNIDGPDFGSIEIKSQRAFTGSKITLFTKAPEPPKINSILREHFGIKKYPDKPELKELHASFFTHFNRTYNKWGFRMRPDDDNKKLFLEIKDLEKNEIKNIDIWYLYDTLKNKIENKLNMLAYAEADKRKTEEGEEFHFKSCTIFFNSNFNAFMELLKNNKIQYDIRIGSYKNPKSKSYGKIHDHGSGFRINRTDLTKMYETFHKI